ncbi:amino acid ABC transporter permease [Lactobacillaceae bacterium Scapto_B20]
MDFNFMIKAFPQLLSVLPITIYLSVLGVLIGLILAVGIAIVREKRTPGLAQFLDLYVSIFRGIPIIVQIYVVYYGLPRLLYALSAQGANDKAITLPSMLIGVVAFALNASANLSEAIRSAYHSVDKSQYEAALSVGLSPVQVVIKIIFPQLVPNFIPNFTNIFLDLIKDTALVYNIGIVEIMGKANILASFGFNYLEAYLDSLVIYLIVCFVFSKLFYFIENRVRATVFA